MTRERRRALLEKRRHAFVPVFGGAKLAKLFGLDGQTLVQADLHGTIAVTRNTAGGTTVTITFPAERHEPAVAT